MMDALFPALLIAACLILLGLPPRLDPAIRLKEWLGRRRPSPAASPPPLYPQTTVTRPMTPCPPEPWSDAELDQAARDALTVADQPEFPDGVFERFGRLWYTCLSCGQDRELKVDLSEFDPEVAYCGGSPRCLP